MENISLSDNSNINLTDENQNEFGKLNYINISKKGTFEKSGSKQSKPKDVDEIIGFIKNNDQINKLVLHFHGGLVSEGDGMNSAKSFYNNFSNTNNALIVSIVWETGFLEALPYTMSRILHREDLLRKLVVKVSRYFGKKLNFKFDSIDDNEFMHSIDNYAILMQSQMKGINDDILLNALSEFEDIVDNEALVRQKVYNESKGLFIDEELSETEILKIYLDEEIYSEEELKYLKEDIELQKSLAFQAIKIISRCIIRFIKGRGHGLWTTIVEESCRSVRIDNFATKLWGRMKDQAENMWKLNTNKPEGSLKQYAGRYLMDKLVDSFSSDDLEIEVVAHSAGAVAVCRWVKAINKNIVKYGKLNINNIVFLAPACTCKLFKETIMTYPDTFKNFRMFTMRDEFEKEDNLISIPVLKYLYPRSLLYLVSGICEGRRFKHADAFILGLHRHINKIKPYSKVELLNEINEYLFLPTEESNKIVLSITMGPEIDGRNCNAIHHGGFTHNCSVVKSIKYLINN